jgi:flagellar motor switch protein FliM
VSSETLSQNEIDALLGGSRSAGAPSAARAPSMRDVGADVQLYDFRRPHRVSKEKLRTLEAMYERFAKSLEGWLLGRVRGNVQLTLQSVEQFSFGEFTLSLPTPCASYIFDVADSGGQQGVIDFGHEFAYFLVDRLFGGSGEPSILQRALTPIERMVVRSVADKVSALLEEIWQDYIELDVRLTGFESIPEILRVANREDPVLVANIEVVAAETSSLLLICLPFGILEKFFAGGTERKVSLVGSVREQEENRVRAEVSLKKTRVPIAARLPEFRLTMREIASLTVGSVVATGVPRNAPLVLRVGTQPRFEAAAGRIGGALAVRVLDQIAPAPDAVSRPSSL